MKFTSVEPHIRRRGSNLPRLGGFNHAVILDAIRRSPEGLSRVELAAVVGLAAQTVSNITRRLINEGLILETGKFSDGPGKPRTILKLNPQGMYAIGVHLDPAETNFALLDLTGTVVSHRSHAIKSDLTPKAAVSMITKEVKSLIKDFKLDSKLVAGLGVASPGPIDSETGTVINPPHLPNWHRVELRKDLAEALEMPVILDKDITAAAVSEIWSYEPSGTGSFLFVYVGTGIGTGIVLNDEVYRGISGNVGEVGHMIADPASKVEVDGLKGRVKGTCMPENVIAEAKEAGVKAVQEAGEDLHDQMAAFAGAVSQGNAKAVKVMKAVTQRFANIVSAQASLLDVDHVVFGGPFWSYFEASFLENLPEELKKLSITSQVHELKVYGTSVSHDIGAVGAACLLLEDAFGPNADSLMLNEGEKVTRKRRRSTSAA